MHGIDVGSSFKSNLPAKEGNIFGFAGESMITGIQQMGESEEERIVTFRIFKDFQLHWF